MTTSELRFNVGGKMSIRRPFMQVAIFLAMLPLAGCECLEPDWERMAAAQPDSATIDDFPECSFDNLKRRSKAAAALAENADPRLLAESRAEAEQECLRVKSETRGDASGSWRTVTR